MSDRVPFTQTFRTILLQHRIDPNSGKLLFRFSDRPEEVFDDVDALYASRGISTQEGCAPQLKLSTPDGKEPGQ